jgi:hypothetical protein
MTDLSLIEKEDLKNLKQQQSSNLEDYIKIIESKGLTVCTFGGQCPGQVHAYWQNGNHLYFRARGNTWDITIATNEEDAIDGKPERDTVLYYSSSTYGKDYEAGYMPLCEVTAIVLEAIEAVDNARD